MAPTRSELNEPECPYCRQRVTQITPIFSKAEKDHPDSKGILKQIKLFNWNQSYLGKLCNMPKQLCLTLCWNDREDTDDEDVTVPDPWSFSSHF